MSTSQHPAGDVTISKETVVVSLPTDKAAAAVESIELRQYLQTGGSKVSNDDVAEDILRRKRESRRVRRQKAIAIVKKIVAFLFSHIGLAAMVVAYSILGGILFRALEAPNEISTNLKLVNLKEEKVESILQLAQHLHLDNVNREIFKRKVRHMLMEFQKNITTAVRDLGWDGNESTDESSLKWSFPSSLLFAVTIITSIGYGHVAPKTAEGRLVTILYAIVGIPLTFLYLSNIGNFLADCFRWFYKRVICDVFCLQRCERRKRRAKERLKRQKAIEERMRTLITQRRKASRTGLENSTDRRDCDRVADSNVSSQLPIVDIPDRLLSVRESVVLETDETLTNINNEFAQKSGGSSLVKESRSLPTISALQANGNKSDGKRLSSLRLSSLRPSATLYNVTAVTETKLATTKEVSDNINNGWTTNNGCEPIRETDILSVTLDRQMSASQVADNVSSSLTPDNLSSETHNQQESIFDRLASCKETDILSNASQSKANLSLNFSISPDSPTKQHQYPVNDTQSIYTNVTQDNNLTATSNSEKNVALHVTNISTQFTDVSHAATKLPKSVSEYGVSRNRASNWQTASNDLNRSASLRQPASVTLASNSPRDSSKSIAKATQSAGKTMQAARKPTSKRRSVKHKRVRTHSHVKDNDAQRLETVSFHNDAFDEMENGAVISQSKVTSAKVAEAEVVRDKVPKRIPVNGRSQQSYLLEPLVHLDGDDMSDSDEKVTVPITVCLILMAGYISLGAVLFARWEEWDFITGCYFCFITLSTIGFGDIVPGMNPTKWENSQKLVLCALWLAFGLSLLAMCFNLMQEEVKEKCKWIGFKLGILRDSNDDDD